MGICDQRISFSSVAKNRLKPLSTVPQSADIIVKCNQPGTKTEDIIKDFRNSIKPSTMGIRVNSTKPVKCSDSEARENLIGVIKTQFGHSYSVEKLSK